MPELDFYSTENMLREVDKENPALANAAVAHCCKAWKRAYRASFAQDQVERFASDHAGEAYRAAMPPLTSRENSSDFVACVAHGILIGAIAANYGSKLLYAAQIAQALGKFAKNSKKPVANALNSADFSAKRSR
jgi:hypothetical protein